MAFDFGTEENLKRYGTPVPPVYNLKAIKTPIHIFWSQNDLLTPLEVPSSWKKSYILLLNYIKFVFLGHSGPSE